ncbi:MAG: PEP-CTERM sorting domain-containing protein [Burkholderiales bacterium]|nr:PEP-CTERM sorting domain-containing protein [Burkholderiales bacterium]
MLDEDHSGNSNRAGFSITLLDAEHKGVEIGFQSDRIFAQHDGTTGPMFTAAENTTSAAHIGALGSFNTWELQVNAGGYALTRGGAAVLAGALRDYSAYTGLGQAAYDSTSFLFVGDNTSSAGSIFTLQYLAITTAPVPEPSAYALLLAGLALVGAGARRRRLP